MVSRRHPSCLPTFPCQLARAAYLFAAREIWRHMGRMVTLAMRLSRVDLVVFDVRLRYAETTRWYLKRQAFTGQRR